MSQAPLCGSQSTHSSVVTALCHTALHFGKCTLALHAHRHSSRIHQPYFSHPECPLVQSAPPPPPHRGASPIYGAPHTGVNLPGGPSYSVTATPSMTSREAIPPLTSFVANREHSQLTRTRGLQGAKHAH